MDILQQDRREASEQRQELCDIITRLQGELQSAEEQRDKVSSKLSLFIHYLVLNQSLAWNSLASMFVTDTTTLHICEDF